MLDQTVNASDLLGVVRSSSGKYLTDLKLFDVYQGKDIENKGKKYRFGLDVSASMPHSYGLGNKFLY